MLNDSKFNFDVFPSWIVVFVLSCPHLPVTSKEAYAETFHLMDSSSATAAFFNPDPFLSIFPFFYLFLFLMF